MDEQHAQREAYNTLLAEDLEQMAARWERAKGIRQFLAAAEPVLLTDMSTSAVAEGTPPAS